MERMLFSVKEICFIKKLRQCPLSRRLPASRGGIVLWESGSVFAAVLVRCAIVWCFLADTPFAACACTHRQGRCRWGRRRILQGACLRLFRRSREQCMPGACSCRPACGKAVWTGKAPESSVQVHPMQRDTGAKGKAEAALVTGLPAAPA